MNKILIIIVIMILVAGGVYYFVARNPSNETFNTGGAIVPDNADPNTPETTIIAQNLDTPWELVFLPDTGMLVTERPGRVRYMNPSGNLESEPVTEIDEVREIGEGGLLGMALHPDFEDNGYVYLYYTYSGQGNNTLNRVIRMKYEDKMLSEQEIVLDAIPGAANHNGGRIAFGPDGLLYVTTGDAQNPSFAQNTDSLAGKILRITPEGDPAPGNPFGNEVYSYGHRNAQGLAWDASGKLWATEHGRSGIQSGLDEINLIKAGANYGWPTIEGDETQEGMETPLVNSGSRDTWAPAAASVLGDTLYFVGLRGSALYEAPIQGSNLGSVSLHYKDTYGRLRVVKAGPDGMLYIATSNQDGRGRPQVGDDTIIRVNPSKL